jgi:hypothetical protein
MFLTKMVKNLLGKNETKLTCFNFVVCKGITLVWFEEPCLSYVEMVAGLPRTNKK